MIIEYKKHFKEVFSANGISDLAIYFCFLSIIGHLIEIPYCLIGHIFFGLVPDDNGVWGYPFEPFVVYGIACCFIIIFILPIYSYLKKKITNKWASIFTLYIIATIIAIVFETGMGLIFNQPVDGKYPLWDNSIMPFNILNQAWIVNDILYGLIIVVFVVWIYPFIQKKLLNKIKSQKKIKLASIVVGVFLINMYITYGIFHE